MRAVSAGSSVAWVARWVDTISAAGEGHREADLLEQRAGILGHVDVGECVGLYMMLGGIRSGDVRRRESSRGVGCWGLGRVVDGLLAPLESRQV